MASPFESELSNDFNHLEKQSEKEEEELETPSISKLPWISLPQASLLDLAFKLKFVQTKFEKLQEGLAEFFTNQSIEDSLAFEAIEKNEDGVELRVPKLENDNFSKSLSQYEESFDSSFHKPQSLLDNSLINESNEKSSTDVLKTSGTLQPFKPRRRFGCGWCQYSTDSKSHLYRHSKALHKNKQVKFSLDHNYEPPPKKYLMSKKRHQCDKCNYQSDSRSHIRRHQASVHCTDKSYECPLCKVEFSKSEDAKQHHLLVHPHKHFDIRNMHKIKHLSPPNISPLPLLLSTSENPSLSSSSSSSTQSLLIRCLQCSQTFFDLWQLRSHMISHHPSQREHFCKVCPYSTNQQQRLLNHMERHQEMFCNCCSFSTSNHQAFKLHFQVCAVVHKASRCLICQQDFRTFDAYHNHMTSFHFHVILRCLKCPFISLNNRDLEAHEKLHSWEERVCGSCGFLADDVETLLSHVATTHVMNDEWNHKWICVECSQADDQLEKAVEHSQNHKQRVSLCPTPGCCFRCLLPSSLEQHLKFMHLNKSSETEVQDVSNAEQTSTNLSFFSQEGVGIKIKTEKEIDEKNIEEEEEDNDDDDYNPKYKKSKKNKKSKNKRPPISNVKATSLTITDPKNNFSDNLPSFHFPVVSSSDTGIPPINANIQNTFTNNDSSKINDQNSE